MMGIYAYVDTMDNSVVYVGKDSYIDKGKRRRDHMLPSLYNHQRFNRVLQNNPNRYEYKEIFVFDEISNAELNQLEMQQIALFNPKFNFTKGGDGFKGGKQSDESRRKISENNARYWQGKTFSEEHRKNLSKARKGEKRRPLSEETKRKIGEANRGKIRTEETRRKLSEAHKGYSPSFETRRKISEINTNDFPTIHKNGVRRGKQTYALYYRGKKLKSSICREKLEVELNKMLEDLK